MFKHDCEKCVYLGPFEKYDLYYHDRPMTLIARYGDEGWAYVSGCEVNHPALAEARRRAQSADLMVQYENTVRHLVSEVQSLPKKDREVFFKLVA